MNKNVKSYLSKKRRRLGKLQKEILACRYLKLSKKDAYQNFEHRDKMSYKTFHYSMGKVFKKPHRETDKCDYCEQGKILKQKIFDFVKTTEIYTPDGFVFDSKSLFEKFKTMYPKSKVITETLKGF